MYYERALFLFGIIITTVPFLGLPVHWLQRVEFLAGLMIIFMAFLMYQERWRLERKIEQKKKSSPMSMPTKSNQIFSPESKSAVGVSSNTSPGIGSFSNQTHV